MTDAVQPSGTGAGAAALSGVALECTDPRALADLAEGERLALGLGATRLGAQADPDRHRVFADPAGHPFCLCPPPAG